MIDWHTGDNHDNNPKFSILIPSWNNLEFLKICIGSIRKNSFFKHQVIVHVNEGVDGTLGWIRENNLDYSYSPVNEGVCWAMNACRALVGADYIVFLNDDMYMLPGWDQELWNEIEQLPDKYFYLSSTTIEPVKSPHPGILSPYDFGKSPSTFMEEKLLRDFKLIRGADWSGATWPPCIVHRDIWDLVGGYSVEYFPGLYSDPDFSMKLYLAGVRFFKGVDSSRVYHFGSRSTSRITMNNGSRQFLNKWGITSASFTRHFLRRGMPFEAGESAARKTRETRIAFFKSNIKRIFWLLSGTGRVKRNRDMV